MPLFRTLLPASICALLCVATLSAQEWTRFRGPNGAGQSEATTIPISWQAGDHLWKAELPGIGHSSPVLWGDKLWVTSADPKSGLRYVMCVSARDGKLLWTREFPARTFAVHQQNSLASSTPTVDAERVYCAWATPDELSVIALDHDGNDAWQAPLGPFVSQHGFGTSPVLFGDLVILTDDQDSESWLLALDRRSGETRWKVPRKVLDKQNASYAAPCVYQPPTGPPELIVCSWAHGVSSIDPLSGKTNWELGVLERRPVGSPILVDGLIVANCGEGSGNNSVVAVRPPHDNKSAELVYKLGRTSSPYVPSIVAHGDLLFLWGDRGVVTCIDAPSGKQHWQNRVGGNYSSSPLRVADRVYCVSAEGEVVVLAASKEFQVLGRSSLGEGTRATPAIAAGRMFLRTESHLVAVGQK